MNNKIRQVQASSNSELKFSKSKQTGNEIHYSDFRNWHDTEESLQTKFDEFLEFYPNIVVIRIPDKIWRIINWLLKYLYSIDQTRITLGKIRSNLKRLLRWLSDSFGGMPDNIILHKNGYFAVELKVKGRRLRQNQKKWANVIKVQTYEKFDSLEKAFEKWLDEMEKN